MLYLLLCGGIYFLRLHKTKTKKAAEGVIFKQTLLQTNKTKSAILFTQIPPTIAPIEVIRHMLPQSYQFPFSVAIRHTCRPPSMPHSINPDFFSRKP